MARFAVLINNVVSNIIIADTKEIAEELTGLTCIEYTNENPVHFDYIWNGSEFIEPIPEEIIQNNV